MTKYFVFGMNNSTKTTSMCIHIPLTRIYIFFSCYLIKKTTLIRLLDTPAHCFDGVNKYGAYSCAQVLIKYNNWARWLVSLLIIPSPAVWGAPYQAG